MSSKIGARSWTGHGLNRNTIALVFVVVSAIAGFLIYQNRDLVFKGAFAPPPSEVKKGLTVESLDKQKADEGPLVEVIADNLEVPWEIDFAENGDMYVTERPGRLLIIKGDTREVIEIDGVSDVGEGGLLGLALHPTFSENNLLYLYYTTGSGGNYENRIDLVELNGTEIVGQEIILNHIPGAENHDGGRLRFGPDYQLYATTGDAQQEELAQDIGSLNGKILRIAPDGSIPESNPLGDSYVYSYGHRNPQGITWTDKGLMWSTEHGRSGAQSGLDELNLIFPSNNYGWPVIDGDQVRADMTNPVIHSGPEETWAPASAEYYNGSIFFGGLRGQALYEARLSEDQQEVKELVMHFREEFGRIRTVRMGPDGYMYLLTSNQDGRGSPKEGDDKIIRIHPDAFKK